MGVSAPHGTKSDLKTLKSSSSLTDSRLVAGALPIGERWRRLLPCTLCEAPGWLYRTYPEPPSPGHTRQAESRLVQVPNRWCLLLGRGRLSRRGWSHRLGCHRHLTHWSVIQATRDPSQLGQLKHTITPQPVSHSQRTSALNPPSEIKQWLRQTRDAKRLGDRPGMPGD